MPGKYMRKPYEVQVMKWDGSEKRAQDIVKWIRDIGEQASYEPEYHSLRGQEGALPTIRIITDQGMFLMHSGDYVVSESSNPHDIQTYTHQGFHRKYESVRAYRAREQQVAELLNT